MHNGVVAHFNQIKRHVVNALSQEALDMVKGTTDSEHLGALFFTCLEKNKGAKAWEHSHSLKEVKHALEKAITQMIGMQKQVIAPEKLEASSLNLAITDGEQLLAIRFRNHATQHPPSLYFSTKAGVSLNRKYPGHPDQTGADNGRQNLKTTEQHGDHVIVASEPSTFQSADWELIKKNECIMVGRDMVLHREMVDVDL